MVVKYKGADTLNKFVLVEGSHDGEVEEVDIKKGQNISQIKEATSTATEETAEKASAEKTSTAEKKTEKKTSEEKVEKEGKETEEKEDKED